MVTKHEGNGPKRKGYRMLDTVHCSNKFAQVVSSCAFVTGSGGNVLIDQEAISRIETILSADNEAAWKFSGVHHYTEEKERAVRYVLCIGAINFGSGYADDLVRIIPNSTYYTMAEHLKNAVIRDRDILSADRLMTLTLNDVCRLFQQDQNLNPHARGLMEEYRRSMFELGQWMLTEYGDDMDRLVSDCTSSERMLEQLLLMESFRDVGEYRGEKVYFYKRAQLLIADFARLGREFGWWHVDGLSQLTIFADNAVAHVMRQLGVLVYSGTLADRIDKGEHLIQGEDAECEIRAASIIAGELLRKNLELRMNWPTILEVDYQLWDISHDSQFRNPSIRRHLTRTINY